MRPLPWGLAAALMLPLASAQAQTYDLFPTDGGGNWQVKCTLIMVDNPPTGPCNGVFANALRVTAAPGGWASVPVAGPAGNAYYISPYASASIWANAPNENPHYEYTFRTTFSVFAGVLQSIDMNVFWFDNYFAGWSLNGSAFSMAGINPPPLAANGANWMTPFQVMLPGTGFVNGVNTLEFRIHGNGRTDGLLAQGTYTVDPPMSAVPEPGAMILVATGLMGLVVAQRLRRKVSV